MSGVGMMDSFGVEVGLHQGSAPSPFLFSVVFDVWTENVQVGTLGDMMYVVDVVLASQKK